MSDAGSGILTIASGATFTDQTTSSGLTITAPSQGGTDTAATSAVNNAGTFIKSGSALTSTISARFNTPAQSVFKREHWFFWWRSDQRQLCSGARGIPSIQLQLHFEWQHIILGRCDLRYGNFDHWCWRNRGSFEFDFRSNVAFANGSGTLTLDNPTTFQSSITGLTVGDTINLPGIAVQSAIVSGSTLTITQTNDQTLQYQVSGALTGNSFSILSNAAGTKLILLPSTGTTITGANNAGTLTFNPNSTQFYKLVGATITGSAGYGILVQTSDSNLADNLIVQADSASSISRHWHQF